MASEKHPQGRRSSSDSPPNPGCTEARPAAINGLKEIGSDQGRLNSIEGGLLKKLGAWLVVLSVGAVALLILAVAILSWLWFATEVDFRWLTVMRSGYVSKTITLVSTAMRTALTMLAGTATSMIASIAVERRGVPLHKIAELSIARFANSGPNSLASLIFGKRAVERFIRVIITVLLLNTLLAQFISTLLISDLRDATLPSTPFTSSFSYNQELAIRDLRLDERFFDVVQRPSSFAAFAEYAEAPNLPREGVDDTGMTLRAFLPIANQAERETLATYDGPARVVDARTVCVRPRILDIGLCEQTELVRAAPLSLCGRVTPDAGHQHIWLPNPDLSNVTILGDIVGDEIVLNFTCPITLGTSSKDFYNWQLCGMPGGTVGIFRNAPSSDLVQKGFFEGSSYLLWNADNFTIQDGFISLQPNTSFGETNTNTQGPWAIRRTVGTGKPEDGAPKIEFDLKLTWCFDGILNQPVKHLDVVAHSNRNRTEPSFVPFDFSTKKYDTQALREQLNATGEILDNDSRQVLSIDQAIKTRIKTQIDRISTQPPEDDWLDFRMGDIPANIALCPDCVNGLLDDLTLADGTLSDLFMAALDQTGSPARALQAFRTAIVRGAYYSQINQFALNTTAATSRHALLQVPLGRAGYWTTIAIVAVQFLLFAFLIIAFSRTRYSLPKNAWHAVAQIAESEEARDLLRVARVATDKEIEERVGAARQRYRVEAGAFVPTTDGSKLGPWIMKGKGS